MANENFGLGFTVEPFAQWAEPTEGTQSPANQFTPIISAENQSPANQFSPIISSEYQSPANQELMAGLCSAPSVLSGPGQSVLSSGGGTSIASCP